MLRTLGRSAAFAAFLAASSLAAPFSAASFAQATTAPAPYVALAPIAGADGGWDYARIDPETGRLFVARSNAVTMVDLGADRTARQLVDAHRAHAVLPLDHGTLLFETDGETGRARFISVPDGRVLADLATGTKPDAAFLDPSTGLLAVMDGKDGTITLIDPKTRTLAGRIMIGGGLEAGVPDGKGNAFVNVEDRSVIARVDLHTRKRTGTIALPGCEAPTGLGLVAQGTRLITACANKVALVLDARSGKLVTTLSIGGDPDAVLVDEQRGLAFIPCGADGTLVPIAIDRADAIHALPAIPTQIGARTGAIDPRDGRLYLPAATLAAPTSGARRGAPVPGSFHILVFAPAQSAAAIAAAAKPGDLSPDLFDPALLVPPPPVRGSILEAQEIATLRALIASASPARLARARWDGEHEDPSAFDAVTGRDLSRLPATAALLEIVRKDAASLATAGKAHFQRLRPYGVVHDLPTCNPVRPDKPLLTSYPSGHALMGYSVGEVLARLMPENAPAILARAADYALSRQYCGVHFPSDTEASHVIGTLVALRLLADPDLAGTVAAARAELAAAPR